MRAKLHHVEKITPTARTFWFETEDLVRFEAGQYLELTVLHQNVDDRGAARWMSLANAPDDPLIAIATNFYPQPSSYKRALLALRPGDEVLLGEPFGDFVLPKDPSMPLAFVVGGIGIAPVRSIIKSLVDRGERRNIQLIYSASSPDEFAFAELFEAYPLDFMPITTQSKTADADGRVADSKNPGEQTGRLNAAQTLAKIGGTAGKLIYLSGPQSLIEPLYNELLKAGVPRAQLVLDYFPGY